MVGKINGLFGVKGWVKIFSHTEPRKNILNYQPWQVKIDNQWQTLELSGGREQSKTVVAGIKGIDDREQARALIGTEIYINREQLPQLAPGEYYWEDLIGLEVINTEGVSLGKVKNLMDTGANAVLISKTHKEHWVPFIEPHLIQVDLEAGQIQVDWDEDF